MRLSELFHLKHKRQSAPSDNQRQTDSVYPSHTAYQSSGTVSLSQQPDLRTLDPSLINPLREPDTSTREVYADLIKKSEEFLRGMSRERVRLPDLEAICEVIERLIEASETRRSSILAYAARTTPEDYLRGHIANVTILSITVSQKMGWPKEIQMAVGLGAWLHDAGMVLHRPTIMRSGALNPEDRKGLRNIPRECLEILKDFIGSLAPESKSIVEKIILQHQERISGKGFPNGLKGDEISHEAQLVGLCDTYESVSHLRPHRQARTPHDALRYILELTAMEFDGSMIKKLWETLTLFPPGSYVRLGTGEVARVLEINEKLPTRPLIMVVVSPDGSKVGENKVIDLSKTPEVAIEKAVDECVVKVRDVRLAIELKARRWWLGT